MNFLKILKETNIWKNYPACKELSDKQFTVLYVVVLGHTKLYFRLASPHCSKTYPPILQTKTICAKKNIDLGTVLPWLYIHILNFVNLLFLASVFTHTMLNSNQNTPLLKTYTSIHMITTNLENNLFVFSAGEITKKLSGSYFILFLFSPKTPKT